MRSLTVAGLVVLLAAFLPPAEAQLPEPKLEIHGQRFEGLLRPEIDAAFLPMTVAYACSGVESPLKTYTIRLKLTETPEYASVVLNPAARSFTADPTTCQMGQTREFNFQMYVTVTRDAPAYVAAEYIVEAVSMEDDVRTAGATFGTTIMNDYVDELVVVPDTTFLLLPPNDTGAFLLRFENQANGPTMVQSEIMNLHPERLRQVEVPPVLRLESCRGDREPCRLEQSLRVHTGEGQPSVVPFELKVLSQFDGVQRPGSFPQEQRIAFSVQVGGTTDGPDPVVATDDPASVPAPALAMLLGAVFLVARRVSGRS